ncbi:unnamed protein product [Rotaria sp. Silwood2]|nr:unnamed protein product [Rotaria sp. Silwood2]CAF3352666.1 unnamed protein product [Rotaria sp. Silwood2]CAF4463891.1 unnamed protein product [Rotaria sp. Silwood2]
MRMIDFNHIKDNVDRLISVNTFFSTTKDYNIAVIYSSCEAYNEGFELISVIFEIEADLTNRTIKRPFASIQDLSAISDELEVLFSVDSIFRIINVQDRRLNERYWYVKMILVGEDNDIKELRNELEKKYCQNSSLCDLGDALIQMGDYERAERYFRMLLEYLPETNSFVSHINASLGMIFSNKGDYQ